MALPDEAGNGYGALGNLKPLLMDERIQEIHLHRSAGARGERGPDLWPNDEAMIDHLQRLAGLDPNGAEQ